MRASTWVLNGGAEQLAFERAEELSHMPLSKQSSTEPIDGRTATSRQRLPKASEV